MPKMNTEQVDRLMSLPQCPHLHKETSICKHASECLGAPWPVDGAFCNATCRQFGPNLGREMLPGQEAYWIELLFSGKYFRWGTKALLAKAWDRHHKPMTIVPPKNLEACREALQPLQDHPAIKTICITGSAIAKEADWPCKDIDVVVVVNSLDAYLDAKDEVDALMPEEIGGIVTDFFVLNFPSAFFITVDLWDLTMYCSVKDTTAKPGPGITGVGNPGNFGRYDEALVRTMERFKETGGNMPLVPPEELNKALAAAGLLDVTPHDAMGLGDMVSKIIKTVTAGKAKECGGCKKRREALNRAGRKVGIGGKK